MHLDVLACWCTGIFKVACTSGAWHSASVNGARLRVRIIELTSGCMRREVEANDKARRNYYPISQKESEVGLYPSGGTNQVSHADSALNMNA